MARTKKIFTTICWFFTGYLAWYLSIYIFSFCFASTAGKIIGYIGKNSGSLLLKNLVIMLVMHSIEFLFCFLLAMFLSFVSQSSLLRVLCFILGAVGISLYIQIEGLIYYLDQYQNLPKNIVNLEIMGFSSFLIVTPAMAFLGSLAGNRIKQRPAL